VAKPPLHAFPGLDLAGLEALARRLAALLAPGDTMALRGDLGAGKTSFARALIRAIAPEKTEVTSPTYTLMQSYDVTLESGPETLWHLDLYRLEDAKEADALGLEELWPHVVIIEWPGIIDSQLPESRLDVTLDFSGTDLRSIAFHGNDAWRQRLAALT